MKKLNKMGSYLKEILIAGGVLAFILTLSIRACEKQENRRLKQSEIQKSVEEIYSKLYNKIFKYKDTKDKKIENDILDLLTDAKVVKNDIEIYFDKRDEIIAYWDKFISKYKETFRQIGRDELSVDDLNKVLDYLVKNKDSVINLMLEEQERKLRPYSSDNRGEASPPTVEGRLPSSTEIESAFDKNGQIKWVKPEKNKDNQKTNAPPQN